MSGVTALVLAGRGGARLDRSLASVAWARERVVWDPDGRLAAAALPVDVHRVREAEDPAARDGWLLLLREGEVAPAALPAAVEAAIARRGTAAFRVPVELRAFGARLRPRYAPVRLAPARGARVVCGPGLVAELEALGMRTERLSAELTMVGAGSLAEAVDDVEADGAAMAALLRRAGRRPRAHHLVVTPLAACARVLLARGDGDGPWARWVLAVLTGYTSMVAWAKRWEQVNMEGAA